MSDVKNNLTAQQRILNQVSKNSMSSEEKSLWEKIRQELQTVGPDGAVRYIGDELDRCKQDFEREFNSLHERSNEISL